MMLNIEGDAKVSRATIARELDRVLGKGHGVLSHPPGVGSAYGDGESFFTGAIPSEQRSDFLRWAKERGSGVIACGMTWDYRFEDLPDIILCELPAMRNERSFPNYQSTHAAQECCSACGSTLWTQQRDLKVKGKHGDVFVSPTYDIIVSSHLASALEAVGASLRPIADRSDVRQLERDGRIDLVPDGGRFALSDKCPTCGIYSDCREQITILGQTPIGSSDEPVVFEYGIPVRIRKYGSSEIHVGVGRQHRGSGTAHGDPTGIMGPMIPIFISKTVLEVLLDAAIDPGILTYCRPAIA